MNKGIKMNKDGLDQNNKLLNTLILNSLTQLDSNIKVIDFGLGSKEFGYIDILAVDSDGALLLINIFTEKQPELVDLLNKYKFIIENKLSLKKLYPSERISDEAKPKIILISNVFSARFTRSLDFINEISIELISYSYSMTSGIKRLNLTRHTSESNVMSESTNNIESLRQQLRNTNDDVDDKEIDTFIQFYE